jgi:hypothetical protein
LRAAAQEINAERDGVEAERAGRRKSMAALTAKLDGLYDAIADGLRTPGLLARIESLESERAALESALAQPAPSPVRLHPNLSELYREKVTALRGVARRSRHPR